MIESIRYLGIEVIHDPFMKPYEYMACDVQTRQETAIKQHFVLKQGNKVFMCTEDFELLKKQLENGRNTETKSMAVNR